MNSVLVGLQVFSPVVGAIRIWEITWLAAAAPPGAGPLLHVAGHVPTPVQTASRRISRHRRGLLVACVTTSGFPGVAPGVTKTLRPPGGFFPFGFSRQTIYPMTCKTLRQVGRGFLLWLISHRLWQLDVFLKHKSQYEVDFVRPIGKVDQGVSVTLHEKDAMSRGISHSHG